MDKNKLKKLAILIWVLVMSVFVVKIAVGFVLQHYFQKPASTTSSQEIQTTQQVSYKGVEGSDALTLLKKKYTDVVQDSTGMVVSINNRKADSQKKEYWAFFVNGKLASVGPAEYETKNTDTIEWRIETY